MFRALFFLTCFVLSGFSEEPPVPLVPHQNPDVAARFSGKFTLFGQVLDQDGAPVQNAEVIGTSGAIVDLGGAADAKQNRYVVKTDQDGKFILQQMQGFSFQIDTITCPGYEVQGWRGVNYMNPNQPQPTQISAENRPLVLHAWKMHGAESVARLPLEGSRPKEIAVHGDTKWIYYNVKIGRCGSEDSKWDLRFRIDSNTTIAKWTPNDHAPEAIKWFPSALQLVVEARNGALLQTDNPLLYAAPADGYSKSINLDWSKGIDSDRFSLTFRIIYKGEKGDFGRLSFFTRIAGDQRPESLTNRKPEDWQFILQMREAFIDPKGPNLEFDYSRSIRTWDEWVKAGQEDER